MVKATTVFSCLFLVTCLGLAVLSSQKSKSLMSGQALKEAALPAVAVAEPPQVPSDVPDFASIEEDTAAASTTGQPAVQAEIPVAVDQPQ